MRVAYTSKAGLKYRCQIYGCLSGEWLYSVVYQAPARYYFDKELPAVLNMMKNLVIEG